MRIPKGALLRAVLITAAVVAFTLIGGSSRSAADTTLQCSHVDPQGRNFCVTIEDLDNVSPSGTFGTGKTQTTVTAFQFYHFTIQNNAGSTLTNGTLSATLTDVTPSANVNSTASFVASDSASFCRQTSTRPNTVSCNVPNIAGGQPADFFLVYRTSTTPGVTATLLSGLAGFKEGTNGPNGANPATTDIGANTSLEPNPQDSVAWSPAGQTTQLGTDPTTDTQFSSLKFTVPNGKPAFQSELAEGAGTLCDSCFGQLVTVSLPAADGTFTPTNLFHLTMTYNLSDPNVPNNTSNMVVVHQPGGDPPPLPETISARCSTSPPDPPAASDALPCIRVTKDNQGQPKLLIIEVWAFHNGGWQPGMS